MLVLSLWRFPFNPSVQLTDEDAHQVFRHIGGGDWKGDL